MPARRRRTPPAPDPTESAEAAGLRYVSDASPGIRRRRAGRGFSYVGLDGRTVRDPATLARIRSLAIPPAYTDVWICPTSNGHLQATGRDARGRKQYRYHPKWREVRDETKFGRMLAFSDALPRPARTGGGRPGKAGAAEGEGAGHRGAAARVHGDPGGQRRVRQIQPLVRAHDPAGPARGDLRSQPALRVPGQEREDPPGLAQRPAARPDRGAMPGGAGRRPVPVPGRRRATGSRSARGT